MMFVVSKFKDSVLESIRVFILFSSVAVKRILHQQS